MIRPQRLLIVFDTDCVLCSGWTHFILRNEHAPVAQFISAWSEQGVQLAAQHGLSPRDLDRTYLVVADGTGLTKSDATFAVFRSLKAPYCWATALRVFPKALRDWVYDTVARNRYRWFGQRDQCFVPNADQKDRFVPGPPRSSVVSDRS